MRRTGGFTLIEVMITVAILGILTGVLVVTLTKPANRVKTGSEVQAMFAAFHQAQQQYRLEQGSYYSTGTGSSDIYPATLTPHLQDIDPLPDDWVTLRVKPGTQKLRCGYVAVAGTVDDDLPDFAADFEMPEPPGSWYVLYARCNADGNATVDAEYFASSIDPALQKRNEGK